MHMHPYMSELLAREHACELRRQAQQARLRVRHPGPSKPKPVRHRVGWALVELGLRLASPSPEG